MLLPSMISSETKEITPEIKIVTKKMMTTQRIVLLRCFLDVLGSDLDTGIPSKYVKEDGSRQDKSYGLGRVGFPRTEPAVAVQVVSL